MRWPWSAQRVVNPPSSSVWPKRIYFLDGPFAGETRDGAMPGLEVVMPTLRVENLMTKINALMARKLGGAFGAPKISYYRYAWETCYPRAEVAYVKLASS